VDHAKVEEDVRELYNAGPGRMGTDSIEFCGIIFNRSNAQIRKIAHVYHHKHHHTLEHAIISEFSGHMQHALLYAVETALHPPVRDARLLHASLEGYGTKEEKLTYRLIRAYWHGGEPHMKELRAVYHERYQHHLVKVVESDTSGHHRHLLDAVLGN
jgi:annexin A7/11